MYISSGSSLRIVIVSHFKKKYKEVYEIDLLSMCFLSGPCRIKEVYEVNFVSMCLCVRFNYL
jgi:hypothetical protein